LSISSVISTLQALRLKEILLMTGFSFVGILFASTISFSALPLVIGFTVSYVMAVYFLNSLAGYHHDKKSDRLEVVSSISKSTYLILFLIATLSFGTLSLLVNLEVFILCISALTVWIAYYLPPFHLKSSFLGGTLAHFVCGILHFHMGYSSFTHINLGSIFISMLFALLLSIGHINHELLDFSPDKKAGLKTTAIRIGTRKAIYLRTFLTIILGVLLIALWQSGKLTTIETLVFAPAVLLMVLFSGFYFKNDPKVFQRVSRAAIACSCLLIVATRIYSQF